MTDKPRPMHWIPLYLALLFLAAGCAHDIRGLPTTEQPAFSLPRPSPHPLHRPEGLESRIRTIQDIQEGTQLRPEDRLLTQELLEAYHAFEKAAPSPLDEELRDLLHLLLSNLMQLEERYFERLFMKPLDETQAITLYSSKRKKIMDSYHSGDYQGVIDRAVAIENLFGADALSPEIGLVFAISLARQGKVQEALRVGAGIRDELERAPGVMELRANMVEWQAALGETKEAVHSYQKLADGLREKEALVRGAERHLSVYGRPQASPEKKPAPPIDFTKEPDSLQEVLGQVDALVGKNEFDAAKLLLLRLAIRLQDKEQAFLVDQAMRSVEEAEQAAREQERSDAFQRQETLELAADLIEQERYEEAIAQIDTVLWEKEFSSEARQLQDLAVEKIVKRQRNEAAKLFLMARNTPDPARKEEYLTASYNILKTLVEKYPINPLYQTIHDNMKRIQEELSKVRKSTG